MAWDDECEARTWELMRGFVDDEGKPTRREQRKTANWLNQMMPYPGWRFEVSLGGKYWLVDHEILGTIVDSVFADSKYTHEMNGKSTDTLMEMITQLEMGL